MKVSKVQIKHVGPPAASDELVRANIRVKAGDTYLPTAVDDDVQNLYATGFFYNIRVTADDTPEGIAVTYILQGKPKVTSIKFHGNKKYSDSKLRKKLSSKEDQLLDERKLFTDAQEIQKMYQTASYPGTEVKYTIGLDDVMGRATATFEITESPKVKIIEVDFRGAQQFPQKKLRKEVKTRKHWWLSWLTRSGILKEEVLEEDKERLAEFYRSHGYIDYELRGEPELVKPTPQTLIVRFNIYEGARYKVGSVKLTGNKLFSTEQIVAGLRSLHEAKGAKGKIGPNGLEMDVGDVFTPHGFSKDIEAVEDFYGAKGYIDVVHNSSTLKVVRIPNTESGTMDIEFQIDEGQKSYIEKIEIRGNTKTKDKVIRRELAVSPGEPFDMVRVKASKLRVEGIDYFSKVDARPEPTDPPITGRKNLVIGVDEKSTGTLTGGAGFSSVDSIVGFVELYQGNFDIFHAPTFTGGGQKFRLRVQMGTERQDYIASFSEPWFLGRKLALDVEAYHQQLSYQSLDSLYDETRTGLRTSLTRALGSDFLKGSVSYTIEDIGINLNPGFHGPIYASVPGPGVPNSGLPDSSSGAPLGDRTGLGGGPTAALAPAPGPPAVKIPANVPDAILAEVGHSLLSRLGSTISFDTRGGGLLPNKGQRTELFGELVGGPLGGDKAFYRLELRTAWYFKGFAPGHVLEVIGHTGVAESFKSGEDVPFYERYYLGGLPTLRGFKYRSVSPRQPGFTEPIGGDTYWFGTAEYSIPIFQQEKERGVGVRFAFFYDIGDVQSESYAYKFSEYSDNWGIGLRLALPIGPLRLDYGIPINHDKYNSSSGKFQFGVGYRREF